MRINLFLKRHKTVILISLFIFALALRLGWTSVTYGRYGMTRWNDARIYYQHGLEFAQGDLFGDNMNYGPVVPLLVAGAKLLTGDPVWPVLVLNCLLNALMVFVLFRLGELLVNPTIGYLMAIWSVFNFAFIRLNNQIMKESLVFLLLPMIVLCVINIYHNRKVFANLISSSLLFSTLIHTDERYMVYTPFILMFILLVIPRKRKVAYPAMWLAILVLTMVPWTIRNYQKYNDIIILAPRTTSFTSHLWGTNISGLHFSSENNTQVNVGYWKDKAEVLGRQFGVQPYSYGPREKYLKAFVHYWKPAYFKLTFIQYGFRGVKWSWSHNLNGIIFYGMFLPFYLAGFFFALFRKYWLMAFLGSLPLVHSLVHTIMIWPLERYRLPMDFLVVLIGIWFCYLMIRRYRRPGYGEARLDCA